MVVRSSLKHFRMPVEVVIHRHFALVLVVQGERRVSSLRDCENSELKPVYRPSSQEIKPRECVLTVVDLPERARFSASMVHRVARSSAALVAGLKPLEFKVEVEGALQMKGDWGRPRCSVRRGACCGVGLAFGGARR